MHLRHASCSQFGNKSVRVAVFSHEVPPGNHRRAVRSVKGGSRS